MLAALTSLPRIRRGALGLGLMSALPCLLSSGAIEAAPVKPYVRQAATTATGAPTDVIPLARAWRFMSDPTDKGVPATENWAAPGYDDSAWRTLQAGTPWEKQGVNYAGNAWYRQKITVPASVAGISPTLVLQEIQSDDEVYFNGVRIGGLTGEYKYADLLKRAYTIPADLVRVGAENTIAIRVWGGPLGFNDQNSGLVGPLGSDAYYLEFDRYRLGVRGADAASTEVPIQLYDFSNTQRGAPFQLVARIAACGTSGAPLTARYELADPFKAKIVSGDVPATAGSDGTCIAEIPVQAREAQTIYFAGRFTVKVTVVDGAGSTVATRDWVADHLRFDSRDQQALPALAEQFDDTPYGRLKLVDTIDTATPPADEAHPYLQGAMGGPELRNMTPGSKATVTVSSILGKSSRQATWSWFAYRVGRGQLQPGRSYLLRIDYPEDVARYMPVEVQAGQNYMDVGLKTGISATNPYERAPLSKRWETYDVIFTLGEETTATGGAGDGDASKGVWLYFPDKRKAGTYFIPFAGGVAVGSIKMYEIDPKANAPKITQLSPGVPARTLTMDWERQPTSRPEDVVTYAALMGYSAVSPVILKWGALNFGVPIGGYVTGSVDAHRYWNRRFDCQKTVACALKPPAGSTVHERFLAATKSANVDYIPRFEYGGSELLEVPARAIGADGKLAKPNRYADWSADLLDDRTFVDFKRYLDAQIGTFAASNPQLKGVLWRIRSDLMPISYGRADVERFYRETGRQLPTDFATLPPVGVAGLVATGPLRPPYVAWWHEQRAAFHARIADTLQGYGNNMRLLYFNWDTDKFSLALPDRNSAAFTTRIVQVGGKRAYADDLAARSGLTAAEYIRILQEGDFSGSIQLPQRQPIELKWPDYALWPSLYANISNVDLLAPMAGYPYADMKELFDYFRSGAGLAVSHLPPYEEFGMRVPHPKYETNVVTPGGGNFSLSTELLSYFYGDARVLTFTSYTIGRGFADAHRRFAQAFRALPAISGEDIASGSPDLKVRLYTTTLGEKYIGVAYKGDTAADFDFNVTTSSAQARLTDLGGNSGAVKGVVGQGRLAVTVRMQPMELRAFRLYE